MKRIAAFIFVVAVAAAALAGLRFYRYCITPYRAGQPAIAEVTVPEGATLRKTAAMLERQGVIRDPELFILLARMEKAAHRIKAGPYQIMLPVAPRDLLGKLVRGEVALVSVTIPEGSTVFDIARIFEQAGLWPAADVLGRATDAKLAAGLGLGTRSLEGFLFPDTYKFSRSMPLEQMLRHMVRRFEEVLDRELAQQPYTGPLSRLQLVVLASLVEKEARVPSERPVIAGVFYNRLKLGMRLDCDPTVVYGLLLEDPQFKGRLLTRHLRTPTPYNTYLIRGLPAGPICNPGLASLQAALRPAPVDYLFFVSRNDGTHQFSRTLQEHNRAVNRYQR